MFIIELHFTSFETKKLLFKKLNVDNKFNKFDDIVFN